MKNIAWLLPARSLLVSPSMAQDRVVRDFRVVRASGDMENELGKLGPLTPVARPP
jgi:hypothetical protein